MTGANNSVSGLGYEWDYLVQPGRVHRSLYVESAIFELEQQRIFGGTWIYLAHVSELAEPNSFVTRHFGSRPLIVTRDKDGELHALINRCSHRGARVCRTMTGKAQFFTCGYHGWTFRNTGECVGIPVDAAYGANFDKTSRNLARVPYVAEYRGFIFGTLNPVKGEKGLVDHLGPAAERMDEWIEHNGGDAGAIRVSSAQRYLVNSNWKCIYDNAGDGYHPEYSHQSLLRMTNRRHGKSRDIDYFSGNIDETPMYSQALGNGHTFLDQRPCMYESSAFERQRPQPGREIIVEQLTSETGRAKALELLETATGAGMNLSIFPNLLFVGNQIQMLIPQSVDKTDMLWHATSLDNVPPAANTLRLRTQEDFPMFGEVDDNANFESCFEGMSVTEMEWVDISRHMETGVERVDERGVITAPISSDLHMRSYFAEWKRLMGVEPEFRSG